MASWLEPVTARALAPAHLPRKARDAFARVQADDRRRAPARRKHGQDAGAAADVQHARAPQQPGVGLERVPVRLGARLRRGAGGRGGWRNACARAFGGASAAQALRGPRTSLYSWLAAGRLPLRPALPVRRAALRAVRTASPSISLWMSK